jgi:hypothetical protein
MVTGRSSFGLPKPCAASAIRLASALLNFSRRTTQTLAVTTDTGRRPGPRSKPKMLEIRPGRELRRRAELGRTFAQRAGQLPVSEGLEIQGGVVSQETRA